MINLPYVSLHNQTTFSTMDALISVQELCELAKKMGHEAVAITDHGTLASMWDAYKIGKKVGVKVIPGCEFNFVESVDYDEPLRHIILLAKNATGYKNLLLLNKLGFDHKAIMFKFAIPRIDWKLLEEHSDGLICTTACGNGIISQLIMQKKYDEAKESLKRLKGIFGDDLAVELQAHALVRKETAYSGAIDQRFINLNLKKLSEELDIKAIVTTNTHYAESKDYRAHDTLLAIRSGQTVFSGNRLKYNVNDFYYKHQLELASFFVRLRGLYPQKFVESLFENTVYFANKCEEPEWIDLKYSNPSGKELPKFPVENQYDYDEYKSWAKDNALNLDDDIGYLRYRCELGLKELIPESKHDEYKERLKEEFDVIEYHGFSSYMLIVADFIDYAKKNDIRVGPGRGCLTGDSLVLSENGFIPLKNITIDDKVYSHTGKLRNVQNVFEYLVDETGLKITTDFSFKPITLTSDHKVFASKSVETQRYKNAKAISTKKSLKRFEKLSKPTWIPAKDLSINDSIFMTFPKRKVINMPNQIDLSEYVSGNDYSIYNDCIIQTINSPGDLSIRKISRKTGLCRGAVQNAKHKSEICYNKTVDEISKYLRDFNLTFDEWVKSDNTYKKTTKRFIDVNEEFFYFLGRWVGDGWIRYKKGSAYVVGMAFNSNDTTGIHRIKQYLSNLGFKLYIKKSKNKNLVQITTVSLALFNLIKSFVPDYKGNSNTKHLPINFRSCSDNQLRSLMHGLIDSDGYVSDYVEVIDSTSKRLILECKEALLYLGIPSSINDRKSYYRGQYKCRKSYKIKFRGIKLPKSSKNNLQNGYFCKIKDINKCKLNKVYDIQVDKDASYLTSNYAVHNSVGGCLIAYLLKIHVADPIKYGLIFARFHNKEKTSFPDIDVDFAPSGRDEVQNYIRQKYGEDYVAHVSNVNTITPKVYVKDIARAHEFGGDRKEAVKIGNEIADFMPSGPSAPKSLTKAKEEYALFAEAMVQFPELEEFADRIGGKPRAWSTHAGGLIIGARPLPGLVPVRRDVHGSVAIEYDKDKAEEIGLVKMDTLGLETLDIITDTYKLIKAVGKDVPPDPPRFDEYDKETYDLISSGDTLCIFQLSGIASTLCQSIKPKSIEEISYINALVRPSAKAIVKDFIATREGKKKVELLDSSLERAFGETYGFGLYEECLLYLAQDVAGWDLHSADRLRKLTKEKGKNPKKVAGWREEFINDGRKQGLNEHIVTKIWDEVVNGFQGYGFNKSLYYLQKVDTFTKDGNFLSSKSIEDIKAGEYVRSRDENTDEDIYIRVIDNHNHGELELVEVELETGEIIKCTMNHKFRVIETGEMLPLYQIIENNYSIVVNTLSPKGRRSESVFPLSRGKDKSLPRLFVS